jgi:ketosteroid isomerase-like protein
VSAENVEIVKGIFARWERGDFSSVDWADPEIEFTMPGPDPKVHRGIEAMARAWADWLRAFKAFGIEPTEFHDAGDRVVVGQVFRGEGRGSGLPLDDITGACVFTLRDGKVVRFAGYTTIERALADAGIEP